MFSFIITLQLCKKLTGNLGERLWNSIHFLWNSIHFCDSSVNLKLFQTIKWTKSHHSLIPFFFDSSKSKEKIFILSHYLSSWSFHSYTLTLSLEKRSTIKQLIPCLWWIVLYIWMDSPYLPNVNFAKETLSSPSAFHYVKVFNTFTIHLCSF